MRVSVLLRLFITVMKYATLLTPSSVYMKSIFKHTKMGCMIPKEMKNDLHYSDVRGDVLPPPHGTNTSCGIVKQTSLLMSKKDWRQTSLFQVNADVKARLRLRTQCQCFVNYYKLTHWSHSNRMVWTTLWTETKYSRTSMTRTSLGPWKFVRDMGSSSHWGTSSGSKWII